VSISVRVLRVQQVTSKRPSPATAVVQPPAPAPAAALFATDDDWSGGGDALGSCGANKVVDQAAAALQSMTLDDLEALVQRHEAKAAAVAAVAPTPAPASRPSYAAAAAACRPMDAPAAFAEPPANKAAEGSAPNWFAPHYVYGIEEPPVNVKAVGTDHALGTAARDHPEHLSTLSPTLNASHRDLSGGSCRLQSCSGSTSASTATRDGAELQTAPARTTAVRSAVAAVGTKATSTRKHAMDKPRRRSSSSSCRWPRALRSAFGKTALNGFGIGLVLATHLRNLTS